MPLLLFLSVIHIGGQADFYKKKYWLEIDACKRIKWAQEMARRSDNYDLTRIFNDNPIKWREALTQKRAAHFPAAL
jgi:hypothetical protein